MSAPSVICVGDNCIDRYVRPVERVLPGGNALNVAVALRHEGITCGYAGAVGADADGRLIVDAARLAGVDVSLIETRSGATGVTLVAVEPSGERRFLHEDYGAAAEFRLTSSISARLRRARWVHFSRQPDAASIVAGLRAAGVTVSYDFCDVWDPDLRDHLCRQLDVAFFSPAEIDTTEAEHLAEEAVRLGAQVAVVTLGAGGSVARAGDSSIWQDAEPVEVTDTLGAGDALIAAFIGGRLHGADVATCLRRGAIAAAAACARPGAWPTTLDSGAPAA